ncbi:MAG: hypothetical protein EX267_12430, partial [Acidimicrobiia bacterium]
MTTTAIAPSPLLSRFVRVGTLTVTQGSRTRLLTGGQPGPSVTVHIQSSRAWVRILRGGALGFAEAYMLGEIDTPDLAEFFVWGALNQEAFRSG